MEISVVIPVYRSEGTLITLTELLITELEKITFSYEIIYVNDCSPDNSLEVLENLSKIYSKVKVISLSRNFGQHPAIYCGLYHSHGDVIIVMDCDLQENPKYIIELYAKYKQGYEIVFTFKKQRKYPIWKNFAVRIYTTIYNYLIDDKRLLTSKNVGSFSLITRKVVDAFLQYGDCQFHYLMVLRWLGFKQSFVEIEHQERTIGKSSYNFKKLFEHALVAIVFQSDKLLRLNIYLGFLISILAFLAGIFVITRYFLYGFAAGWASIFVLILFSLGIILFSLGILGLYIGKMFEQTKNRPIFIVDKKINI